MKGAVSTCSSRSALGAVLVAFALGLYVVFPGMRWLAQKKSSQYRDDVLSEVTALARTINRERMQALTYTKADLQSEEYVRLSEQLRAFAPVSRFHSVYCVSRQDGKFVLGPSAEADSCGRLMEPGKSFENPPVELAVAFESRLAQVTGPRTQEDGTFVYAVVPVLDMKAKEVLFAVVARIDSSSWLMTFARLLVGPVLFAMALVLVILGGVGLLRRYMLEPHLRSGLWRYGEVLLVASVGVIFTLVLSWIVNDSVKHVRRLNYQAYVQPHAGEINSLLRVLGRRLENISQLLGGEPCVTRAVFGRLISPYLRGSIVQHWLWVPILTQSEVAQAVDAARQEGAPDFLIWRAGEGQARAAVKASERYCPVLCGMPAESCHALLGYDVQSDPGLRTVLEKAGASGLLTGSGPVTFPFGADGAHVILLVQPVFNATARDAAVRGYLVAVVRPESVLRQSFPVHDDENQPELKAEFYQLDAGKRPTFLAASAAVQAPRFAGQLQPAKRRVFGLCVTVPVFEFGRTYVIVVRAGPSYFATHSLWLCKATAVAGSVLTLLLMGFVGFMTRRRFALEDQITARTTELERVGQQVAAILDSAADGILGLDQDGSVAVANASAAQMLGYDMDKLIGLPSHIVWHHDAIDSEPCSLEECPIYTTYKYGTEHHTPDAVFWRMNGTSFHVAFVSKPFYHQEQLSGAVITFRDITEQRESETNLKQTYAELERINSALKEAGQVKTQFLAHMSHEIRTPLNCVIGMTGLLLNTRLDEEQQEYAETIRVSGESLLDIVNEILDFSKIEAQKMELEKQPFDLRHCVEDAVDLVAPAAAAKKLELTYLIDETIPNWWIGDATRLRQILANLLSNAVKFTEQGEVDLTLSGRPNDDGSYQIMFSVQDTGVGIPPDKLDRLFQAFSQVDVSTTRRFGGTGLGLAISQRLCELMGGSMVVESSGLSGQGATFRFSVPLVPDYSLRGVVEQAVTSRTFAGKKALLAEHNASSRETLAHQLKALGLNFAEVDSVGAALQRLCTLDLFGVSEVFDVAVIDMQLADADGRPLGEVISGMPGRENLPQVLLSPLGAHVDSDPVARHIAHVTKPVKLVHLFEAINKVMTLRPLTRRMASLPRHGYDSDIGKSHPLRILLAEDNIVNQKVAVRILSKVGYRVDVVSNGLEALETLRRTSYDVVLMDVQMPELDGEQASILIRRELAVERQPWIVAMTANAMNGDRERYQAAGMNDYIPKPIRVERLVEVLVAVQPLSASQQADAVPSCD